VGEAMVDRRGSRGCDRVEEFIYGSALMGMGVMNGPIHRCRGQQAGRVWFTSSRENEGIREGGRFGGVYKRERERGEASHAQSLGFKREMVSALLEGVEK